MMLNLEDNKSFSIKSIDIPRLFLYNIWKLYTFFTYIVLDRKL